MFNVRKYLLASKIGQGFTSSSSAQKQKETKLSTDQIMSLLSKTEFYQGIRNPQCKTVKLVEPAISSKD